MGYHMPVSYLLSSVTKHVHYAILLLHDMHLVSCASIALGTYNCRHTSYTPHTSLGHGDMHSCSVTYISQVRIAGSRAQSIVLDVAESIVHEPSIATRVTILPGAVHKLLLAEGGEGACLLVHLSLESTRGTKGPAGATLSLVLHLGGWREGGGRREEGGGRRV